MDTSRRSSTSSDDEQRDRTNKEVLDVIDALDVTDAPDATQPDEQNADGLHESASPDTRLDKHIELEEEKQESLCNKINDKMMELCELTKLEEEERESLRNKINEKMMELEVVSAAINPLLGELVQLLEKENELLHSEKFMKGKMLEAANAVINEMIDILEQQNETLRTTAGLKLRTLMQVAIYGRTLDVTAIENETWRIVQLLVDIRDAKARQHRANLMDIHRLLAEIDAEDEGYPPSSSAESSSDD